MFYIKNLLTLIWKFPIWWGGMIFWWSSFILILHKAPISAHLKQEYKFIMIFEKNLEFNFFQEKLPHIPGVLKVSPYNSQKLTKILNVSSIDHSALKVSVDSTKTYNKLKEMSRGGNYTLSPISSPPFQREFLLALPYLLGGLFLLWSLKAFSVSKDWIKLIEIYQRRTKITFKGKMLVLGGIWIVVSIFYPPQWIHVCIVFSVLLCSICAQHFA